MGGAEEEGALCGIGLAFHRSLSRVNDDTNAEYLTCLPKHMTEVPSKVEEMEEFTMLFESEEWQGYLRKFARALSSGMPPGVRNEGRIFRAVIEEGLWWGTAAKPFIPGLKSWSGGMRMRMRMLAQIARGGDTFADNTQAAIIMHPGCFDKRDIFDVMSSEIIPSALMCWARDDLLVPYAASDMYLDAAAQRVVVAVGMEGMVPMSSW